MSESGTTNRVWRLRSRPVGEVKESDLELCIEALPEPAQGQMLIKNIFFSIDPTHRIWMSDKEQYMPKVELGEVMRAATIGEVVSHNTDYPDYPVGTKLVCFGGMCDYFVGIPGANIMYKAGTLSLPLTADLSVCSIIIGLTAWHGVKRILAPSSGDIVVVSGAAGAVGSLVGQLAKARGATVVGIAGTDDKCAWLTNSLKFDLAINYKTQDVAKELKAFAPEGITHYFDNVGGNVTDAVFLCARLNAKFALCGSISEYEDSWVGQRNYNMILMRRINVQGFICTDHIPSMSDMLADVSPLVLSNKIKYEEDIRDGLQNYISVLNLLFSGGNKGKLILKV